ncbi:PH domain-containing protein [Streptomyces sp. ODS28]|uniref:PH domain-containing protein n=1 Tax=Streptomyces sp. ODS28 TaxID=3136688 RepID=UPI0031E68D79
MTSESEPTGAAQAPAPSAANTPQYADRCYRSPAGMAGGVVLLAIGAWLGADAVVRGTGRTPWIAVAGLLLMVPLVVAFTLRPAVYAGEARLRVRNPFRTVHVPWGAVESLRAGYSSEVVAAGTKYQLWSIPVSLRARNKAARHNDRIASGRGPAPRRRGAPEVEDASPRRAHADVAMDELRELAARHEGASAAGEVRVRWAWEILTPLVVGTVSLALLLAGG